jgi:ribosomal protein L20
MQGFRGRAKNCISLARNKVEKALQYAYRDRRNKKRDMRALWIQRINAGSKQHGVSPARTGWHLVLRQPSVWQVHLLATGLQP